MPLNGCERSERAGEGERRPSGPRSGGGEDHAADPDTLLATHLNGRPLNADHGFPLRLIAPNRPGVLQTKWVTTLEVL